MAGPAPKTKEWRARENLQKPEGLHIIVSGQVEVSDANQAPVLSEGPSAGDVLPLDLAIITTEEPTIGVPVWKTASYDQIVSADQFHRVQVRWDGKEIAVFPVIDDSEHGAITDKASDLQNVKYGAKSKAKKVAAKAKKTVKKVAAKVKSLVKKVTKKVTKKKVAKKPVKKAAKKAAKPAPKKRAKGKKGKGKKR